MSKAKEDKPKKLNDSDAKDLLSQYMKEQNRPYNEKMVFENLHGAVGKTQVGKLLETLVTEDFLACKEFGKTKIYWVNQKCFPVADKDKIAELDAQIKTLETESAAKQSEAKALANESNAMGAQLSDEEIAAQIIELEKKTAAQAKKLASIRGGGAQVSRADFDSTERLLQKAIAEWKKRRTMVTSILADLGEGTGKTNKELKKLIGFEDDADAGVDLQQYTTTYVKKTGAPLAGPTAKKAKLN